MVDPKWGAYTADALMHYPSGLGRIPCSLIHAFGLQKQASARANAHLQELPVPIADAIALAAQEVAAGAWDAHFPLGMWQAGDGNQTHINVNEVIACRAAELMAETKAGSPDIGSVAEIHPLDHVNRNQSSNDSWPTVVHMALARELQASFSSSLETLATALDLFAARHHETAKVGRTFLRDAHCTTVGMEFRGFAALLRGSQSHLATACETLRVLPQGGGAVGNGAGVHPGFGTRFAEELRTLTGMPFQSAPQPCAAQVVDTALLTVWSGLVMISVVCLKLCRDIELLGSGPACGLGELLLPAVGPGSSSMAGKVNPTHASMLEMMCMKVLSDHAMVCASLSSARLQLNTTYLLAACVTVDAVETLGQGLECFASSCIDQLEVHHSQLDVHLAKGPGARYLQSRELGYDAVARQDVQ
ncbi:lyase family protein [Xanthomonas sp. WHRI 10064A]|uniref:lyase family protein n=1 Tax=unclassified Xanthomonas TaxID=2643310 RepID=UPI002B23334C|nr:MULTISPECIES: lyase family protein [unclassified Xanthomonas]MEA9585893.1 lyase family protein [Xanthomonas sp. WHRI 10064B]MEA9614320.1 lyase family protein [Xanthomonas sp. WHRI 10064A]